MRFQYNGGLPALLLATSLLGVGCGKDKCNPGDLECILDHLYLLQGGEEIPLAVLPTDRVRPRSTLGTEAPDAGVPPAGQPLGCYIDRNQPDLDGTADFSPAMTLEACLSICRTRGYRYAGLQDRSWCYCGDRYGRYGMAPTSDCYMRCSGNPAQICGAWLRNSIYDSGATGGGNHGAGSCPPDFPRACPGGYCCDRAHPYCCGERTCSSSASCGDTGGAVTPVCPAGYPIDCHNGFCCDSAHPVCCPGATCSTSADCGGVGAAPEPPTITGQPPPMMFDDKKNENPLELPFQDPNGCTPTFCMSVCSKNVRCSGRSICTRQVRDGLISGVWRTVLGVKYEPTAQTDTFTMQITPLSAPNWADPIDLIERGASAQAGGSPITGDGAVPLGGAGVTIDATVTAPKPNPGGGGGGGEICSDFASGCRVCSIKACVTRGGSGCTSAGYRTSDGKWFPCVGCESCTGAAQAVTMYCCPPPPH